MSDENGQLRALARSGNTTGLDVTTTYYILGSRIVQQGHKNPQDLLSEILKLLSVTRHYLTMIEASGVHSNETQSAIGRLGQRTPYLAGEMSY